MKYVLFLLAMVATSSTNALELTRQSEVFMVRIGNHAYPATKIGDVRGNVGQDMDQFVIELGKNLRDYTQETGFEVCASICRSSDGLFGAQLFTMQSHTVCPIPPKCPSGMEVSGQTIHSHTTMRSYKINRADMAVMGIGAKVGGSMHGDNPELFSDEDFGGGPGYMVSATTVWHQQGKREVRMVGKLQ